jgi:methylenetetrahydrofolate reductase (NADPH)
MSQLTVVPKTFHCDLPEPLYHEAVKCTTDEEMRRVGIEWSVTQCRELKSRGVPSMHFYTMGAVDSICEIARQVY